MPTDKDGFLPVLGNGEFYIEGVTKKPGGFPVEFPEPYEVARARIRKSIQDVRSQMRKLPDQMRLPEYVICLRLYPEFLAKTYYPKALLASDWLKDVGSRRWESQYHAEQRKNRLTKMLFVRTSDDGLARLERRLDSNSESTAFTQDIQKLEALDTLAPHERILGFGQKWERGTVEMVLHPFESLQDEALDALIGLLRGAGVQTDTVKIRPYPPGPTFVSVYLTRQQLLRLGTFNPLRTAHPMGPVSLPKLRKALGPAAPHPPAAGAKSSITVGVFDGGLDQSSPLIADFARLAPNAVWSRPDIECVAHGTAVSGAVLYGPLNDYKPTDTLPQPTVSVEMFRALPTVNPHDDDLYESIDLIEEVVPQRPDVKVYNVSIGPKGIILEDDISRFTFALDRLSWEHKVLFIVAVGNDGDLESPEDRIQAPSDVVNGLGVGAHTYDSQNRKVRAPYSSVGPGREGCKMKPDVTAFGGCSNRPIHLVGSNGFGRVTAEGTSFAAPIVAGRAAELIGRCDRLTPLVARAILVHTAHHPTGMPDYQLGHGVIANSVEEMLACSKTEVTVIFQHSLRPKLFAKLPIPFLAISGVSGNVEIRWTIALLSRVDQLNADEYTECCVEDVFYPNANKFIFTDPLRKKSRRLHIIRDRAEVNELLSRQWTQSEYPDPSSGNIYKTEHQRRGEYKWDTTVRRSSSHRLRSLENPYIVLHGMGRNKYGAADPMHYAAIVTVSIPSYAGNLYDEVRTLYSQLEPLRLKTVSQVLVPVS